MAIDEARTLGAMALFGEKYGDVVRVVSMGGEGGGVDFSIELCGGTHVNRTGDIGLFKIVSESGVAAGVRRIEAVSGKTALALVRRNEEQLRQAAALVKSSPEALPERLRQLLASHKALEKEIDQLKGRLASSSGTDLSTRAEQVKHIKLLTANIDGLNAKALRDTTDQLKNKLGSAVVVLATTEDGKVSLVAGVTQDLTGTLKAGEIVNLVAEQVGGKGGGRPDMAMAGGSRPEALEEALRSVRAYVEARL
jgi:alanyl-tRNA synthetase